MTNIQDFYKVILDEMNTAYALFEVVYGPQGQPLDYLVVEANSAWEHLLGVRGDMIFGKMLSEIHKPEAFIKAKRLCDKAVISREKASIDIYLDRFKIWYRTELIPKMHYLAVLVTDVTYFKNLEIASHDNEKIAAVHKHLFNSMLDAMDDGLCLLGPGLSFIGCNVEFRKMFPDITQKNIVKFMGETLAAKLQNMEDKTSEIAAVVYAGERYELRSNVVNASEDERLIMCFLKKSI